MTWNSTLVHRKLHLGLCHHVCGDDARVHNVHAIVGVLIAESLEKLVHCNLTGLVGRAVGTASARNREDGGADANVDCIRRLGREECLNAVQYAEDVDLRDAC